MPRVFFYFFLLNLGSALDPRVLWWISRSLAREIGGFLLILLPIMCFFVIINSSPPCLSLAVLEGIAISSNRDYKVLGSTYPWIARKVLTDSSPKLKASLQALLYKVNL